MSALGLETSYGVEELSLAELLRFYLSDEAIVAPPAAGAEWSKATDGGEFWEIRAVTMTLTTSAVVANRSAKLVCRDNNGNEVWRIPPVVVQAAGAAVVYTYLPGLGYSSNVDGQLLGIASPPAVLRPGWSLGSLTSLIDVGDAYTKIVIMTLRWSPQRVALALDWIGHRPRSAR